MELAGNDHWRAARLNRIQNALQVRVGDGHTAVGGLRSTRELGAGRAVQPDAAAGLASAQVERVGVVERQRARAIEVGQLLGVEPAGDVVDAQRCALIALEFLFGSELAHRRVVVGHQTQALLAVFKQIQARARRVYGDGMARAVGDFDKGRRNGARCWAQALGSHALARLLAQFGQCRCCFGRGRRHVAKLRQRARARSQQIAQCQLCELEVRKITRKALCLSQGLIGAALGRQPIHANQPGFGLIGTG